MLLPDQHRQVISSRLMTQQSPPVSPLLYQPGTFPVANSPQFEVPAGSTLQAAAVAAHAQQYTTLQHKPAITLTCTETWVPKMEYSPSSSSNPLSFEVSSTPVGYSCHPTMRTAIQHSLQQSHGNYPTMPKIEQASSPAELHMDIQP